ncbi:hypothetical protein [Paenibacillus spongiae]|uniref:Uncharacterized protein n=1 Tax=Paenibacillus spongiae TaxID=2909671 RepID=A0ABY5SB63_9BACL|nr:hypothetical protein [Paenibacillus spongiae]UVI31186.1 hypothetical protein L1F29_04910 [Paenibacillus spongiae]
METWTALVLRHKPTGLYYGRDLERTKSLRKAWRWYDEEQLSVWLNASIYVPEQPEQYEPVSIRIAMEEE